MELLDLPWLVVNLVLDRLAPPPSVPTSGAAYAHFRATPWKILDTMQRTILAALN